MEQVRPFDCLKVPVLHTFLLELIVKPVRLFLQCLEYIQAVLQMLIAVLIPGGPHGLYIQAHVFSVLTVSVFLQHLDLVKGRPQVFHAKGLVLVILDSVLVVEVHGHQFPHCHGKSDFMGRVKTGQDGVGALQVSAHPLGVNGGCRHSQHMAHGPADASVNGLVWLWLNAYPDIRIIFQHFVDGMNQHLCGPHRGFGLRTEGSLPCQPQHHHIAAQLLCNVNGAVSPPHGVFPVLL